MLVAHEITGPFSVGGMEILPFEQDHGWMKSLGFRFGKFRLFNRRRRAG